MYVSRNYNIINDVNFAFETLTYADAPAVQTQSYNTTFGSCRGEVHMYQADISGNNVIDYAFKKGSIFCIKAFVETLLILTGEEQFRNCFDKAILLMINRGMDVKDLVNSELFYPEIWTKYSLFSPIEEPVIIPYAGDIEDLEFADPNIVFSDANRNLEQSFDKSNSNYAEKAMMGISKKFYEDEDQNRLLNKSKQDQYEMRYNYIFLQEIEAGDKINISRTLKDSTDIELFEQPAI